MTEPRRYFSSPFEVVGFELTGYGDFIRAKEWVNSFGGDAVVASSPDDDYLLVTTYDGYLIEARVGWVVMKLADGRFLPVDPEMFDLLGFSIIAEPVYDEGLTGTGSYVVGRPDGSTALVGGAALQLPMPT